MLEIVIGVGQQTSLRDIVDIADAELREKRGVPRIVTGHAELPEFEEDHVESMRFEAERPKYDADFSSFTLFLRASGPIVDELTRTSEGLQSVCAHTQDDGEHRFQCPPPGTDDPEGARRAVDELSKHFELPEVWRFDGDRYRTDPISIEMLFRAMLQYKASDIHLSPGDKPVFRVDNQTHHADILGTLSAAQIFSLIKQIAPAAAWEEFDTRKQCSFGFHQAGLGYARSSAFLKSGVPHLTFRYLPESVPAFDELHIPEDRLKALGKLHSGLVLLAGMTGSGKSTSVAALVDWINTNRLCHILTIEDPVEYVHPNKKAIVSQRSLGEDVETFGEAVEGALRHDPDVIVIGEMRDPDTIRAAISAASTGHLVISTLHANNASSVVNRVVSFFDPVERDLVRQQLQDTLRCVICQILVPKKGGGRVPALEMLFNDIKPISTAMAEGNTLGIRIGMQQNLSQSILFEQYLFQMTKKGLITKEIAKEYTPDLSLYEQIEMGTYTIPRIL